MAKSIEERIAATMRKASEGDPALWRHPLAEATLALLKAGEPVTVETLIARLEIVGEGAAVELKRPSSEAAIDRLRQIVMKQN